MCCCKQERLAEGDFKELKDVEIPTVGERAQGSKEWYKVMTKVLNQGRESMPGSRQTVSHGALALCQRLSSYRGQRRCSLNTDDMDDV